MAFFFPFAGARGPAGGGGGSNPTGPAGGDLGGSYPNPTVTQAAGLKSATTTVAVAAATAPTSGQVLTATSSTAATWQTSPLPYLLAAEVALGSDQGSYTPNGYIKGFGFVSLTPLGSDPDHYDVITFSNPTALPLNRLLLTWSFPRNVDIVGFVNMAGLDSNTTIEIYYPDRDVGGVSVNVIVWILPA